MLLAYGREYDLWKAFGEEIDDLISLAPSAEAKDAAEHASHTANWKRADIALRACQIQASTVREFGLQARLVADELLDWWEQKQPSLDPGEAHCRLILDHLMIAAGVQRPAIESRTPDDIRRALLGRGQKARA